MTGRNQLEADSSNIHRVSVHDPANSVSKMQSSASVHAISSLPSSASRVCLVWSKDADWVGDTFPLNREHLDLDSMLVQSSEDAHRLPLCSPGCWGLEL